MVATAKSHWVHACSHAATGRCVAFACAQLIMSVIAVSGASKRLWKLLAVSVLDAGSMCELALAMTGNVVLSGSFMEDDVAVPASLELAIASMASRDELASLVPCAAVLCSSRVCVPRITVNQ